MHSAVREEHRRRRQQRIVQVREQSKEIAAKVRKRVSDERRRQQEHIEEVKVDEMQRWRNCRKATTAGLATTLPDACEEARREKETNVLHRQRLEELDLMCAQRGRDALRKVINDRPNPIRRKTRSKSTEVQTDLTSFTDTYPSSAPYSAVSQPRGGLLDIPAVECSLPPESLDHDHHQHDHAPHIPLISDRSLEILEKSKRFVSEAQKRLDDLSGRLVRCSSADRCSSDRVPEVSPVKQQPLTVRMNRVTELRTVRNQRRQAPKPTTMRQTKAPRKVIPSNATACSAPVGKNANTSSSSVLCYDHPNRFTKKYEIPKSIIVKNLGDYREEEDDAVTNAQNETLTRLEEDQQKEKRSRLLKQKENIRELEAMEKSQVRRDYEMLAETLEEVRKSEVKNASNSFNSSAGRQALRGGTDDSVPIAVAFEKIVHQPIRISCPRVEEGQAAMALNVGHDDDGGESVAEYSSTDSGKTLILDQLSRRNERLPQEARNPNKRGVVVVTENNASNVKVVSAVQEGRHEPLKIIIQVESSRSNRSEEERRTKERDFVDRKIRLLDESTVSTNYMSPPSELETQMGRMLGPNAKQQTKQLKKLVGAVEKGNKGNPDLKAYITKLLRMPRNQLEKYSESEVSAVSTPSNSVLEIRSNVVGNQRLCDEKKLNRVERIIQDSYSVLEEVDELIVQDHQKVPQKNKTEREPPRVPQESSKSPSESLLPSSDTIMERYATMASSYNNRIHSLTKMIKIIRAEKENLMHDNGISTLTTSERDTSTKYKDFAAHGQEVMTSSASEISKSPEAGHAGGGGGGGPNYAPFHPHRPAFGTANKVIGLSRDSGISMSRPVTSTDVREDFEPLLRDIPKQRPLPPYQEVIVENVGKRRPPNSIARYTPEEIQAVAGHDLSTIVEVDTPGALNATATGGQPEKVGHIQRFPTIEEFVVGENQTGSLLSERGGPEDESIHLKRFVSFNRFVTDQGDDATATGGAQEPPGLDLSQIADELRRRSLLERPAASPDQEQNNIGDEKKYLRSLSKELEEMIRRINSGGVLATERPDLSALTTNTTMRGSSGAENCDEGHDSTIAKLLGEIQARKFPTREEFNRQNDSQHFKSAEILNSLLEAERSGGEPAGPSSRLFDPRNEDPSRYQRPPPPVANEATSPRKSPGRPGSQGARGPRGQSERRGQQPGAHLNLSDDLMNALENNLSEMKLKWAVNMLKKQQKQQQQRSSSSLSTSAENVSKGEEEEAIPFESQTMSLLTDLEQSSISDESKTSNRNLLIRELLRGTRSASSSGMKSRRAAEAEEGRGGLRTSTPMNSHVSNSTRVGGGGPCSSTTASSTSTTLMDCEKSGGGGSPHSDLFSGESKLSSVREDDGLAERLITPDLKLINTLSTEYSRNEHNKRRLNRRRKE